VKVFNAFRFDSETIDEEALKVLGSLLHKRQILEMLSLECKIQFQLGGQKREIGLEPDSVLTENAKLKIRQLIAAGRNSTPTKSMVKSLSFAMQCLPEISCIVFINNICFIF
jgi:hypothetical protein